MRPQTNYESCLARCLLEMVDPKHAPDEDERCFLAALEVSKVDYVGGHLRYIADRYGVSLRRLVEFDGFLKNLPPPKRGVTHEQRFIDLTVLEKTAKPFIVYIDSYALTNATHEPHFVIIDEGTSSHYRIKDPWDGSEREIDKRTILRGIELLRDHLKYSPQLIAVK